METGYRFAVAGAEREPQPPIQYLSTWGYPRHRRLSWKYLFRDSKLEISGFNFRSGSPFTYSTSSHVRNCTGPILTLTFSRLPETLRNRRDGIPNGAFLPFTPSHPIQAGRWAGGWEWNLIYSRPAALPGSADGEGGGSLKPCGQRVARVGHTMESLEIASSNPL